MGLRSEGFRLDVRAKTKNENGLICGYADYPTVNSLPMPEHIFMEDISHQSLGDNRKMQVC